ncbi:hypothetical protein FHR75_000417 [Kineococcus radiotolerans]|uniref:Uncharacterized protein n=1 Tax=Kineococcus radiotolerans TaxID=131568 RepID=A0A7W4XVW9_KINRA|nr:hypothetical protein [Kineococcus radiotolerans]MBB2899629.1 hypothetical protein [Kineococcus radiotolerans]
MQELLTQVRETHGETARVVRAERIRSGGVAGFFSKERYEVTVEMDSETGSEDPAAGAQTGPGPVEGEEREALDFEALLAAADAAESAAESLPEPAPAPAQAQPAEDFEAARQGLLEVLRASGADAPELTAPAAFKVLPAGAEDHGVIAQTGDSTPVETGGDVEHDREVEAGAQAAGFEAQLLEQARRQAERAEQERFEQERADAERAEAERAEIERIERAEAERAEQERAERAAQQRIEQERAEQERAEAERVERERAARAEQQRVEQQRMEQQRIEQERAEQERLAAQQEADRRAREEERMRQQQIERQHAQEVSRREAAREQELRREEARADVRRRQAERVARTAPATRSLGEVLAAADAAEGTNRLEAMFTAGRSQAPVPAQAAPRREQAPLRPHRPISTESDSFAQTLASMRSSASTGGEAVRPTRTSATGVTADVRSVTKQPARPARPRPGRPVVEASTRTVRSSEDRVSDQFGAANGVAPNASPGRRADQFEARGPVRRPELRRPAAVADQFADQFGDQFGDRFAERGIEERRAEWAGEHEQPGQDFEAAYQQDLAGHYAPEQDERAPRQDERVAREYTAVNGYQTTSARDGDENEAMSMDLTYREPMSTYSERAVQRPVYREPQDTGDVLRLARDIEVPAPLRVGAGELVVVIGEADAVVSAALLVADEVGSEAPVVLGRADVQNTVTADELPARQDQARRWSAPLTVAVPARPTGADAERAARMAAEIGAASVVVCVDATRRSHAVASLLRALEAVGLPARRLAVHRAAESPDPLDVLSLDVPVGFLDGRPATSGAWAGLLLDAAGDHGAR